MATFSQMELAAAILDVVPQMDAEVVTIRIIMEKLAARFGVDVKTIRAQRAEIKQLVMNNYGQEEEPDQESDAEKENDDGSSSNSRGRLQSQASPATRKPARKANESEDEASEQDEEEEEADDDGGDDSEAQASDSDSDAPKRKRARSKSTPAKRKAPAAKHEKASEKKATAPAKKPRQAASMGSPGIAALKEMARAARLLSPRVYGALKQLDSEEEQEELIRDLLRTNGIKFSGRYPQKREIDDVRRKKDLEKDLEGIDTSLIIKDTSIRSRRARGAVSYAEQLRNKPASDDEEEEEREEEDGGEGSEAKEKKPVVKRRKKVEESDEAEDDDDAFEANDSDSSEAEF